MKFIVFDLRIEIVVFDLRVFLGNLTETKVVRSDNSSGSRADKAFYEFFGSLCLIGTVGAFKDFVQYDKIIVFMFSTINLRRFSSAKK